VNHMFVVKHNKQFNSDSQRLALSLRVEFSVYGAMFKFSVCAAHTLIGRYAKMLYGIYREYTIEPNIKEINKMFIRLKRNFW
ncbi:hypothetical protein, partial [Vibrio ouci]|uniref:hypothetical protein n=1 Tax=Vibrio ouci TaxID=2499078 RepID=UPI001ABFBC74